MTRPFVIDINHANNVQDTPGPLGGFAQAKASGIAFLFHKATEGLTFADPRYGARRAAWMDGIPVSVIDVNGEGLQITPRFAAYHFFHGTDPVREAQFFLDTAKLQPGDDAAVDWEALPGSGISRAPTRSTRFATSSKARLASRSSSIRAMSLRSSSGARTRALPSAVCGSPTTTIPGRCSRLGTIRGSGRTTATIKAADRTLFPGSTATATTPRSSGR